MHRILVFALVFSVILATVSGQKRTITVGSPRAGETLYKGRTYQVRWASSGVAARVMVELVHRTGLVVFSTETENDGLFDLTIPNNISEGQYTAAVSSLDRSVRGSSGSFTVAALSEAKTLASPKARVKGTIRVEAHSNVTTRVEGGEVYIVCVGSFLNVKWTTTGIVPNIVNLTLHPPDCAGPGAYLRTANTSAGQALVWMQPTLVEGFFSVRVGEIHGFFGCSNRIHLYRWIFVTEPNSRTVWHPGDRVTIRWRRERPAFTGRIEIIMIYENEIRSSALLAHVDESAGAATVTLPADLRLGRYAVMIKSDISGRYDRGGGWPESEQFRVERR